MFLNKSGHTVQFRSNKSFKFKMNSEVYSFQQMNFYWRSSEHRIGVRKIAVKNKVTFAKFMYHFYPVLKNCFV